MPGIGGRHGSIFIGIHNDQDSNCCCCVDFKTGWMIPPIELKTFNDLIDATNTVLRANYEQIQRSNLGFVLNNLNPNVAKTTAVSNPSVQSLRTQLVDDMDAASMTEIQALSNVISQTKADDGTINQPI
jgi:hypothetical protein